jgi:hypothetical protein
MGHTLVVPGLPDVAANIAEDRDSSVPVGEARRIDEEPVAFPMAPPRPTETEAGSPSVSSALPVQERPTPVAAVEPSEEPKRVLLLGCFVGMDLASWAKWETLDWFASWQEPDTYCTTDLYRMGFSGSWWTNVPPGPVSIECRFKIEAMSTAIATLDVRPSQGSPSYFVPEELRLQSAVTPFADELASVDLEGKLSITEIVIEEPPGVRCERLVAVLSNPHNGESLTIEPDSQRTFHLVAPPSDLEYEITFQAAGWADKTLACTAPAGSRVLRVTYP